MLPIEKAGVTNTPAPKARADSASGLVVWLTGLSSSGKSTLAKLVSGHLRALGWRVEWLDGDVVRKQLSRDLGFDKEDREENIRRIGYIAEMLCRHGIVVVVSAISPYRSAREEVRRRVGKFLEVYVNAPLAGCEHRDVKGLYRQAREGTVANLTGVDAPYEQPLAAEVECLTAEETPSASTAKILASIERRLEPFYSQNQRRLEAR